jgi:hypothetical protein
MGASFGESQTVHGPGKTHVPMDDLTSIQRSGADYHLAMTFKGQQYSPMSHQIVHKRKAGKQYNKFSRGIAGIRRILETL